MKKALIEIKNINKAYRRGEQVIPVLRDISLSVQPGEFLTVMGQSGSGKSTLLNILGLLDSPDSGEYLLNQKDVTNLSEKKQALIHSRQISFVFQQYNLIPRMTVIKQVALPLFYQRVSPRARLDRAKQALEKVGLSKFWDRKPSELSGGQQQRVTIARAIITNPDIILADEPTGALDSKTGQEIMAIFQDLNQQGSTIIMITHEEGIAKYAERIMHLKDGEFNDQ